MKHYDNPKLASIYLERVRDMMEGRREMPPLLFKSRGNEYHLSDGDLCALPPYFKRTMSHLPPLDPESVLMFLRGRVVERSMAKETDPICVDGIWMTIDDAEPPEPFKVVEIKSTEWGTHFFDPVENSPHWIERGMGYCHGHGVTEMGLVVFFLSGNKSDFWSWDKDKRPPKGTPIIRAAIKAWTLEFTPEEIVANWEEALRRKAILECALAMGGGIDDEEVTRRLPVTVYKKSKKKSYWQCKSCQFRGVCHIYERLTLGLPLAGENGAHQPAQLS